MAIYIQLVKSEEDGSAATYDFGPSEEIIGQVVISKATGEVSLLSTSRPERTDFYLPRVARVLTRHHRERKYPERTCYAA